MEQQGTTPGQGLMPSALHRKRMKITVACSACRQRKIKCDGLRPVCNNCKKSPTTRECVYMKRSDGTDASVKESDSSLRKKPESHNTLHGSLKTPHSRSSQSTSQPSYVASSTNRSPNGSESMIAGSSLVNSMSPSTNPHVLDSMNGVTGDPTQTREVFGSSSAGSFMRQIQAAIDARLGIIHPSTQKETAAAREPSADDFPSYSSYEESTLFLLPPRGIGDNLMQAYWDNSWALFPIVHRSRVEQAYGFLWTSKSMRGVPPILMTIINLCFTLGCHYSNVILPKERRITGNDFFDRAERLYKKAGDMPSCEKVQCLLLFGVYLQSTSNVFQSWMTVGQAIRMAQSLGIHLPQPASYPESISQKEHKRRTWHGCVWLDRVLSATFGRPGMIPQWLFNSLPFPSTIDDEFFETQDEGSATRPDGRPCLMTFFVKAVELYQILDEILVSLYLTSNRNEELEGKLTQILELDGKIKKWNKSLPSNLRINSTPENDPILRRQAIVLRVRFLHVRILLLRPAVVRYCMRGAKSTEESSSPDSNDSSLSDAMLTECSRICFRAAHELIGIFSQNLDPETITGPLPIWWYSVLYVYTATIMILMERFLQKKEGALKEPDAYHTWHTALHILKSYSMVADSASRCVAALEIIFENLALGDESIHIFTKPAPGNSEMAHDWDSCWGVPNLLGAEPGNPDPEFLSFSFDDFIWLNSMPGPYCQIPPSIP